MSVPGVPRQRPAYALDVARFVRWPSQDGARVLRLLRAVRVVASSLYWQNRVDQMRASGYEPVRLAPDFLVWQRTRVDP